MEIKVQRYEAVDPILEGDEVVRIYFRTNRLVFSVASILPGLKGAVDPGHEGADEVAYVVRGRVVVQVGDVTKELKAGDAILIPEGVPHQAINVGEEQALMIWVAAPSLGREPIHGRLPLKRNHF